MPILRGTRRYPILSGGQEYYQKVLALGPIAYWPIGELTGTTIKCLVNSAQNGTYSGVSLGQDGIGDGLTSGLWDGANDYGDVYSTTFRDAFDGCTGGVTFWYYPGSGVWSDGMVRFFFRLYGGASDDFAISKYSAANQIRYRAQRNGTFVSYAYTVPVAARSDWLHIAMMWNTTQVLCYCNRVLVQTLSLAQSWTGTLNANYTLLGAAEKTPTLVTNGRLGHFCVFDKTLDGMVVADLGVV